ncbi:alpha/beta hydrolase [Sphingomonas sp. AOB5]|uniref:alpha/beta fold hydrolase n=1 Tax=Sphingomonas sp. AOB5 TaxID=3034017 RepID=UPI0023F89A13|nr:alpha/beta hydrolase [Sphingomonas sp. AOB5]MDF7773740.1 alpha/beta hydrolase [Sphingomonas sp. AOB5]
MPTQILFVQGAGEGVHDGSDDKLVASLKRELGGGYSVIYPRMPDEADPQYAIWRPALREALGGLEDGAVLVGHSVGGTMLIHALAEQAPDFRIGALALIAAPFIGKHGWPSDELAERHDFGERLPAGAPVFLYHGTADEEVPPAHLQLYVHTMPDAVARLLDGRDHQLGNDLSAVAADLAAVS